MNADGTQQVLAKSDVASRVRTSTNQRWLAYLQMQPDNKAPAVVTRVDGRTGKSVTVELGTGDYGDIIVGVGNDGRVAVQLATPATPYAGVDDYGPDPYSLG